MAHLELKNIRKSFGAVEVIKGVDLDIRSGEFMVFVGPSGCGKSTLLRLLAGLVDDRGRDVKEMLVPKIGNGEPAVSL